LPEAAPQDRFPPPAFTIHHLLDTLDIGGAETLVASLAQLHRRDGHRLAVHCLWNSGPLAEGLPPQGIAVFDHRASHAPGAFFRLYRSLRRHRPHILHCHNIGPTVLGALAARLARVPAVFSTRHGPSTHQPRRERKFWLAARFCRRVIAVSEFARRDLAADPWALPERLLCIYNGAAPPPPAPKPPDALEKRGPTLLSVGRLTPAKDYPCLLQAFALASRSRPDLQLWILGGGPERPRLEQLLDQLRLRPAVHLLGARRDVAWWLAQADLFVLASLREGLPVSLIEAMALGLPAVVTDAGGMPEVIQASGAGLVVPRSQPEAFARAILDLLARPDRLPLLSQAARRCYQERFTLQRMADEYMALYRDALARPSQRTQPHQNIDQQD